MLAHVRCIQCACVLLQRIENWDLVMFLLHMLQVCVVGPGLGSISPAKSNRAASDQTSAGSRRTKNPTGLLCCVHVQLLLY